ncbi:MAG TPA: MlaD family protein [Thermoleophilaceae bacterium]|nr:MlaD family protein [Thermoleophilaceae bacterium]
MSRARKLRLVAVGALCAVAAVVGALALGVGSSGYVVNAQFSDGSQLVTGDLVQVGGRKVGKVSAIGLTDDGLAEVEMTLDGDVAPLRRGTRASVRTVGLSGVANRFVDLSPGPESAGEIPDGGVLGPDDTRGVVDLDALLNGFDPKARRDIRGIVRDASVALNPETARQTNAGLAVLNPAVGQLTELNRELTRDDAALRSMLTHTASVSGVLARHRDGLATGIDATAGVFDAVAAEREALADSLARAPGALAMSRRTLRRVRTRTLPVLDPVVRDTRPALKPLGQLLEVVEPTVGDALPLLTEVRRLVPQARRTLAPLPRLERPASPAIASTTKALRQARPLLAGTRPYTPELVAGFVTGLGGTAAAAYDANGHYNRINLLATANTLTGLLPALPAGRLGGLRTRLDARCPGAAEEPAPDRSNPWAAGPGSGAGTCDPGHSP